jgi:hypothetical protein
MARINNGRVVAGGLAAGLVINAAEILSANVFGSQYEEMFAGLNLPPMGTGSLVALVVGGFAIGVILTWTYAAMRPRFGPGPKTALYAGLVVWSLGWLWQMVVDVATGFYTLSLWMWGMAIAWTFVEVQLAALIGGWLYREGDVSA